MKLTPEIIKNNGFKRINNSMFRLDNITLQNSHITKGVNLYERILNIERSFKLCYNGKFYKTIVTEEDLINTLNEIVNKEK